MRANRLLARANQVHGEKPLVQRNFAIGKDGADDNGELLAAVLALPQAWARALALQFVVLADNGAVRADHAIRPAQRFKVFAGFVGVLEVRSEDVSGRHDSVSLAMAESCASSLGLSSI